VQRALTGLALRHFKTAVSQGILDECAAVTAKLRIPLFPQAQPSGAVAWIAAKSLRAEPMPRRGKMSRDAADKVLAASAVATRTASVVTQDRDLLTLQKPLGVQVVTPAQLIHALQLWSCVNGEDGRLLTLPWGAARPTGGQRQRAKQPQADAFTLCG
jgi:predicted nucleic acid-binding protein